MAETFELYWDEITAWAALAGVLITALTIVWVLTIKRDPTSALAWCLVVFFLPFLGTALFIFLGYQQVQRPVSRKARHKRAFRNQEAPQADWEPSAIAGLAQVNGADSMARLAQ